MAKSIDALIEHFTGLPGIGPRSAQRLTLYLLAHNRPLGRILAENLAAAMDHVQECVRCRSFTDEETCDICRDGSRERRLCIVESPVDLLAIERSGGYRGYYFVLHGRLSPVDGVGPKQLFLDRLSELAHKRDYEEIILATNPTVEGEVTAHYISKFLESAGIPITRIAHGVPMGGELEYVDGGTLSHAFMGRVAYKTNDTESDPGH